ncbi:hypothetical protein FK220_014610 [Flavobacteriaceae bacterium TP-CH-4]|uniref:Zinc ribbon domain-containing protein n=1 Tax=Pelagihabitans pacificus TaxID=2696054 RepID=A0A967AUF4_9FLAO|nr:hypothetical protein [Pelagihabitans pacificus]NHF60584.1 hypothetical protein [Pelagihabitans pacificus]
MGEKKYRICQNCGTTNLNRDYCKKCGELININLKRRLQREQSAVEKKASIEKRPKNRITVFFEKATKNENPLIRLTAKFFYSIWVIIIAIGSFLAFIIGYVAA